MLVVHPTGIAEIEEGTHRTDGRRRDDYRARHDGRDRDLDRQRGDRARTVFQDRRRHDRVHPPDGRRRSPAATPPRRHPHPRLSRLRLARHQLRTLTACLSSPRSVVIVDALRTPIGRRGGGLSSLHPAEVLARTQAGLIERSGIDPAEVGQVVGGCVSQVGEQSFNVTRTAWLSAGLPMETAATTVDTQCGSSQQATNLATSLIGSGVVDVAVACGVELMSRIPIGINSSKKLGLGVPIPKTYFASVRDDLAVRGCRADRRQVGRHPRRHRCVRVRVAGARRPGVGRGPVRRSVLRGRGTRSRRGRRGARFDAHRCPRRGPARDEHSRSWRPSSRSAARTVSTLPATRHRSPTALRRC